MRRITLGSDSRGLRARLTRPGPRSRDRAVRGGAGDVTGARTIQRVERVLEGGAVHLDAGKAARVERRIVGLRAGPPDTSRIASKL